MPWPPRRQVSRMHEGSVFPWPLKFYPEIVIARHSFRTFMQLESFLRPLINSQTFQDVWPNRYCQTARANHHRKSRIVAKSFVWYGFEPLNRLLDRSSRSAWSNSLRLGTSVPSQPPREVAN